MNIQKLQLEYFTEDCIEIMTFDIEHARSVQTPTAPKMVCNSYCDFSTICWTFVAKEIKKKILQHPMGKCPTKGLVIRRREVTGAEG
uniref:Uncharacterized protein n=1 Tax=Romanomermis culicivorax TaxID=13658 RepID=A0A915JQQ2_ROMCU